MIVPFTYIQFHLAFLVPAVLFLIATGFVSRSVDAGSDAHRPRGWRHYWAGVVIITVVALAYTTPWDNYLIARGVWWYGEERTLLRLWHAPLEEYLFIVVQPWITALWLSHFEADATWERGGSPVAWRVGGLAVATGIGLAGWRFLGTDGAFYLGAVLAWAAPVLALQWIVGAPQLWTRRRTVALGTLLPTLYLCLADRIAIEFGIWVLSARYTTGLTIGGLPIEEATFFLVTNLFVVQGLILYRLVTVRWTTETAAGDRRPADDPDRTSAEFGGD
ncbi:lycopene cyclase domain-containing protein [Halorubrum sp. SD626R]|uniref:lycopene cyclase domain-containing protein n=1 Tax=Halorubrum TaxID=56688 RepID=UPI0010F78940|nr:MULTISPECIES: lycopene cyclase domain-containing protein [Halorubrum]TKX79248.1 lycopene cyclase domain-containing protein [Halorubrum sp. SD626R]